MTPSDTTPFLPAKLDMEISLAAIASATARLADGMDEVLDLLRTQNGNRIDVAAMESEIRMIAKSMPERSLESLVSDLWAIFDEINKRING